MSNRPYTWTGEIDTHKYDDIIELPHYISQRRPHMSLLDRAAQFSPFDALEGYDEEISETARTTEARIELSEEQTEALNRKIAKLHELCEAAAHARYQGQKAALPTVTVTYFVPDRDTNRHSKKSGGSYVRCTAQLRRVDTETGVIVLQQSSRESASAIRISNVMDIRTANQ